jgi:uncharacterized protein
VIDTILSADARAQKAGLTQQAHRPWPLPGGPWVMGQTWTSLLFAHWRVDADVVRREVPAQVPLDTFDGEAWIGVTPFEVRGIRPRGTPPLPRISRFPELNVRTYVTLDGKPGIWFFSLDAGNPLAVAAARVTYRLPYFHARMSITRQAGAVAYRSERDDAAFAGRYRAVGPVAPGQPGTLEHWLTERYCLYTVHDDRVLRAEIHHPPWPLQAAEAEIERNTMTAPLGIELSGEPLVHFAERQDVLVWRPAQV